MRRRRGADGKSTIKDVARAAKVAVGTVSRVVNAHPSVDPATRQRVERVIARLGYEPNAIAQSMRTRVTRTVGFVVPDISNPNWAWILGAASRILQPRGYTVVVASTGGERALELDVLGVFARRRPDALILALDSGDDGVLARALRQLRMPIVMMERELPGPWDAVMTDHAGGAYTATRHLLGLGHRRIALITASERVRPGAQRVQGYTRAFADEQLPVEPDLLRCGSFDPDFAFRETSSLLSRRDPPTAIVAGGIQLLAGVLRAAGLHGAAIPSALSVVSCGDTDLAQLASPPVTVARWDVKAIGVAAAEAVLRRLRGAASAAPARVVLESELVVRESCAPPCARRPGRCQARIQSP
ncbi:MAG: LacI family DNA-binding transcriptional regulator [Candidatus Rokubacteria bacterium]|nr:LacI family DNA-binding transcriptional regulator [Candidatus Rokubacteria bacterium]